MGQCCSNCGCQAPVRAESLNDRDISSALLLPTSIIVSPPLSQPDSVDLFYILTGDHLLFSSVHCDLVCQCGVFHAAAKPLSNGLDILGFKDVEPDAAVDYTVKVRKWRSEEIKHEYRMRLELFERGRLGSGRVTCDVPPLSPWTTLRTGIHVADPGLMLPSYLPPGTNMTYLTCLVNTLGASLALRTAELQARADTRAESDASSDFRWNIFYGVVIALVVLWAAFCITCTIIVYQDLERHDLERQSLLDMQQAKDPHLSIPGSIRTRVSASKG